MWADNEIVRDNIKRELERETSNKKQDTSLIFYKFHLIDVYFKYKKGGATHNGVGVLYKSVNGLPEHNLLRVFVVSGKDGRVADMENNDIKVYSVYVNMEEYDETRPRLNISPSILGLTRKFFVRSSDLFLLSFGLEGDTELEEVGLYGGIERFYAPCFSIGKIRPSRSTWKMNILYTTEIVAFDELMLKGDINIMMNDGNTVGRYVFNDSDEFALD